MIVNFAQVIADLDPDALLEVIAASRDDADYYLATLMPERLQPNYHVETGNMTIRATMAGLVGMDSPYPEGGVIDVASFLEKSAKIAITIPMTEEVIRTIQELVMRYSLQNNGAGAPDPESFLTEEALNFFETVVLQALKDTREWLRGQALTGEIDWTFNKKRLAVNYGFPTEHLLTQRTGNDKYSGSTSKFWDDIKMQGRLLRGSARIIRLVHPDLADDIVYNPINSLNVVNESNSSVTVQKVQTIGDNRVPTGDARDTVTLIKYGDEGEVLDPASTAGVTKKLPFVERGQMHAIGSGVNRGYRVGQGSAPERNELELGFTAMCPTVEGHGAMGEWGRVYTPQDRPYQLIGDGVENCLPVIEGNRRVVNGRSDMSV